jgi:urease accessory protein
MTLLFKQKNNDQSSPFLDEAEVLLLSCFERMRSRLAVMLPSGRGAAIILPRGEYLEPGDVLMSETGEYLRIEAAQESLLCIKTETPYDLIRVVYHLANRHARAMLGVDAVYIEPDPILAEMARRLGASVEPVMLPFMPERGAYAGGHHHHGECDADDQTMGGVGEALSIAAHTAVTPAITTSTHTHPSTTE